MLVNEQIHRFVIAPKFCSEVIKFGQMKKSKYFVDLISIVLERKEKNKIVTE